MHRVCRVVFLDFLFLHFQENAAEEAPESIRAKYSVGSFNAAHASSSDIDVEREEKLLFSQETLALIKPDAAEKSEDIVKQLESCGFTIKVLNIFHIDLHKNPGNSRY